MPQIKPYTAADGSRRYRFRVDTGRDAGGRRIQEQHTFATREQAKAELARIENERRRGVYVRPSRETNNELFDAYLKSATFEKEAATVRSYTDALRCARELIGGKLAQDTTRADIEAVRDYMLTRGRKIGGRPGTGLGPRSVILALGRIQAAYELAVADGRLVRNPAEHVRRPRLARGQRETWTKAEVRAFLAEASRHRLYAAWRLSLYGLRRGEVCGLRWADVDLKGKTIAVRNARVLVAGNVIEKAPKSSNALRVLPLDKTVTDALTALRKQQMTEAAAAARAYRPSGYVVTDELGAPVDPEWYSDEWARLIRRAKVRRIRLHDSRHTALSLMEKAGVPVSVIAAWAGHYSAAFTMATYVHAEAEDLAGGRDALGRIYGSGEPS